MRYYEREITQLVADILSVQIVPVVKFIAKIKAELDLDILAH